RLGRTCFPATLEHQLRCLVLWWFALELPTTNNHRKNRRERTDPYHSFASVVILSTTTKLWRSLRFDRLSRIVRTTNRRFPPPWSVECVIVRKPKDRSFISDFHKCRSGLHFVA